MKNARKYLDETKRRLHVDQCTFDLVVYCPRRMVSFAVIFMSVLEILIQPCMHDGFSDDGNPTLSPIGIKVQIHLDPQRHKGEFFVVQFFLQCLLIIAIDRYPGRPCKGGD